MKLQVTYTKRADGNSRADITVADPGDYPTRLIFNATHKVKPSEWEDKKIKERVSSNFSIGCDYPKEIERMVSLEITTLKKYLQEWRNIPLPKNEVVEI